MIYLKDILQIDKNIENFNSSSMVIAKNTKYLVMHTSKKLLAPLKECICVGGKDSENYQRANGNTAYLEALSLGYVGAENSWAKGTLVKSHYEFLHDRDYIILKFVPSAKINDVYLKYVQAEQDLRNLFGRPNERNEPLGQFGEFLYCKLFGVVENSKLNVMGHDLIDPISKKKIQIKVARKASTNKQGIEVNFSRDFDLLAIFWLGNDRKVNKFFEITKSELLEIVKKRQTGNGTIDIKESDLSSEQIVRSSKVIVKAVKLHGLEDIFDLS